MRAARRDKTVSKHNEKKNKVIDGQYRGRQPAKQYPLSSQASNALD
jgi:hypothetical protein